MAVNYHGTRRTRTRKHGLHNVNVTGDGFFYHKNHKLGATNWDFRRKSGHPRTSDGTTGANYILFSEAWTPFVDDSSSHCGGVSDALTERQLAFCQPLNR